MDEQWSKIKEILSRGPSREKSAVLPMVLLCLLTLSVQLINILVFVVAALCRTVYLFDLQAFIARKILDLSGRDHIGNKIRDEFTERPMPGRLEVKLGCGRCALGLTDSCETTEDSGVASFGICHRCVEPATLFRSEWGSLVCIDCSNKEGGLDNESALLISEAIETSEKIKRARAS